MRWENGVLAHSVTQMTGSMSVFTSKKHFPGGSDGKESACHAGGSRFDPWVGKIPWRREWQPTPVFLPGEFHRQRSLAGDSPWGRKESDMTEQLSLSLATKIQNVLLPDKREVNR